MTDIPHRKPEPMPLVRCSVLYIGSTIPLETVAGLDAFKMPLRERYTLTDGHLLGIDATLAIFSAGILLRYTADEASSVWFPIQTLHVCAALKAFRTAVGGLDFAAVDSTLARDSQHPPIFAAINRRTKGIKVLECHMFVCKSVADATTLVQACINAYEQKEGWLDEDSFKQTSDSLPRIVPARLASSYPESGFNAAREIGDGCNIDFLKQQQARVPLQGFLSSNRQDLIQKYSVIGYEDNGKRSVGETALQGSKTGQKPAIVLQQPPFTGTDDVMTSSTLTSFPVVAPVGFGPWTTQTQYLVPEGYLAGWKPYGSMPYMFVPASSFYSDETHLKKKKKQSKVPTRDKSKASTKTDEENEEEIIEEFYYVKPAYAPTYRPMVVQETGARDGEPRHGTAPQYQTGSLQHASRYAAGGLEQQYIIHTPNIQRNEGSPMEQHYLHGSLQHNGNVNRLDSQNNLVPATHVSSANDQPTQNEILDEPIPDYPTEPTDVYSVPHVETRLPRTSQGKHRAHQSEAIYGHYSPAADKVDSPRDHRHLNDDIRLYETQSPAESSGHHGSKLQSAESAGKRGYTQLVDELGYLP